MRQDKDWMDAMRSVLRDAEVPPPAGGWQRLERALGAEAPRAQVRRIHWPRLAAAAAVVVACIAAGELLWHADHEVGKDGVVIVSTVSSGNAAEPISAAALAQATPIPALEDQLPAAEPSRAALKRAVLTPSASSIASSATSSAVSDQSLETGASESAGAAEPQAATEATSSSAAQPATRPATRAAKATQQSVVTNTQREPFKAYTPPRKKTSFGLFAGGSVSGGAVAGGAGTYSLTNMPMMDASGMMIVQRLNYDDYSFRHHQPLSFGLSVRKDFPYGLSLESGVTYTFLSSDVKIRYAPKDIRQQLHFIGVPLRLNWQFFERGRFSLYMGVGGMVEKCVLAKLGSRTMSEPRVQWSASGAVGAQYRLGGVVGLYFEPEASYYFTKTDLPTARTASPLTLSLRLGVRLSF